MNSSSIKVYYLIVAQFFFVGLATVAQNFGHYASATYIETCVDSKFYNVLLERAEPDCINPDCNIVYPNKDFGDFFVGSGDLIFKGGETKTFKDVNSNVCGSRLYYLLYTVGNRPLNPLFEVINLPFRCDCTVDNNNNGTAETFCDSYGPCIARDQKWNKMDELIDLTANPEGSYVLEVYFDVLGNFSSPTEGCNDIVLVNNSGQNYLAYFNLVDIDITADGPMTFCQGEDIVLTSSSTSNNIWTTGETSQSITVTTSGNYGVSLIGLNGCGSSLSNAVQVTVNQAPFVDAGQNITACIGQNLTINATGGQTYVWSSGIPNGSSFQASESVTLYVTGTNTATGCSAIDSLEVSVLQSPIADVIASNNSYAPGDQIYFQNLSSDANSFEIDFGDNSMDQTATVLGNFEHSYDLEGNYWVVLEATNGVCSDIDSLLISIAPSGAIEFPNVFTVNEDNLNDIFFANSKNLNELSISIFNRWGNIMFESNKIDFKWDGNVNGKSATEGTYLYVFKAKDKQGTNLEGHGFVTLLIDK